MANTPPPDDRFYKPATLWKVFGIASMAMLVVTLWMLLDDFGRTWKGVQFEFFGLRQKKYNEWINEAKGKVDEAALTAANEQLKQAIEHFKEKDKEVERLNKELVAAVTKEKITTSKFQGEKAIWDVEKYEYEAHYGHKVAEGHTDLPPKAKTSYNKLNQHWAMIEKLRDQMNSSVQKREDIEKAIAAIKADMKTAEKAVAAARGQLGDLEAAKASTDLTLGRLLRSAPIVDMANPVLRLQQIVLPTIRDDYYFAQVQKVDRCTTCHMAIDVPGFEKEAQPFRTHPKLDLILGSRSPHPMEKIGCTVCHEGRGQATEFSRTAHTPQNEEQKKEWQRKYGWHEMHHVIEKMIPLQYTEGKCRVCHKQTEYVPRAEKLNRSVQLVKAAGCYGCHRIEGWDHVRKPAPSLKRAKGKLTRDWIVKWVSNPRSFNQHARMPAAFFQSNTDSEEFKQFQEAEVQALADYILSLSEGYDPNFKVALGSPEKGKELFGTIGCLACHQIDDFERTRGRFSQAPDLSTVGSKVSKDWLTTWLKNPRHYWADTTMPSLRLTDVEIGQLAAYLLSKKNADFDAKPAGQPNLEVQKQVLKLYLMRDPKMAPATDEKVNGVVASLQPHEVTMQLGQNAVMRYGCFGCHEIKGYEKTQGIGKDLSEEGSQPLNKFDFGLMHLEHSNVAWFDKKLENPRVFDTGVVKEYLDLLRMPNYEFQPEERQPLIRFLLGLVSQKVSPPAAKALAAHEVLAEEGMRVIHKYNCQGCHVIEGIHQPLPEDHPGYEEHEKEKYSAEGRILKYYSDDETLGPPPLISQSQRTKTPWLHAFLENPGQLKMRAKLKLRMPTFQMSNEEINRIVGGWAAAGHVEMPVEIDSTPTLTGEEANAGKTLFTKLQCLNCHTVGRTPSPEEMEGGSRGLAPDLIHAKKRLRYEWVVELLKDPQKMIPGTRMPGFWPDGTSPAPEILGGDSQKQIRALAAYVMNLGK